MLLVVITPPEIISGETDFIERMADNKIDRIHIRKPEADQKMLRNYLSKIDSRYRNKLVMHYYPELVEEFGLAGFHYNNSNIRQSDSHCFHHKSYSAHSINELLEIENKKLSYCFLSSIFDSISKQGYRQAFDLEELSAFFKRQKLHNPIVALGGIDESNIKKTEIAGFQGVALLGSVWNRFKNEPAENVIAYLNKMKELCDHSF